MSSPGKGTTTVSYDPVTGLLASVTAPTGVVVTALERDPVTDALKQLRTDRGALVYDQWFRYDGQERLARAWDSIGSGNEFNPDVTLFYRYATATTPASITATTLVSAPSSVRTATDLLTAKGEAIGSGSSRSSTENGTFVQTHAADAAGNLTAYWNEAGTAWGYVYDALGRLREVQLPDGKAHRVSFDGHGRVSRVEREGIAVIDYGYEPVSAPARRGWRRARRPPGCSPGSRSHHRRGTRAASFESAARSRRASVRSAAGPPRGS